MHLVIKAVSEKGKRLNIRNESQSGRSGQGALKGALDAWFDESENCLFRPPRHHFHVLPWTSIAGVLRAGQLPEDVLSRAAALDGRWLQKTLRWHRSAQAGCAGSGTAVVSFSSSMEKMARTSAQRIEPMRSLYTSS